jgi:eukaryotic-like serine/threonine-protein kinase
MRLLPLPGGAGFAPVFQGDRPPTLADQLSVLPLEQLVRYLMDVLAALGALHEDQEGGRGLVHGEVCPRHVFIIDGIARLLPVVGRPGSPATKPVASSYGAPELLLDEAPDHRADIFSVGAMLWEAMTGAPPFSDRSPSGLRHQLELRPSELPDPAAAPRDVQLGAIARRALSAPVLRYQNAIEFSNALGRALEQRAGSTPRSVVFDDEPLEAAAPPPPPFQRSVTPFATVITRARPSLDAPLPVRRLRSLTGVAAVLCLALIVVVGSSRVGTSPLASSNAEPHRTESPVAAPPPASAAPASRAPSADRELCPATCESAAAPSVSASEPRPPARSRAAPKRSQPLPQVSANDYGI